MNIQALQRKLEDLKGFGQDINYITDKEMLNYEIMIKSLELEEKKIYFLDDIAMTLKETNAQLRTINQTLEQAKL